MFSPTLVLRITELRSYNRMLGIILSVIRKSKLLPWDAPKTQLFGQLQQETPIPSESVVLNFDKDMREELGRVFQEPLISVKSTVSSPPFKALNNLFTALIMSHKVEGEMSKAVGSIRALPTNPDLRKALDALFQASMATWWLG